MDTSIDFLTANLAQCLIEIRQRRNLTQSQMAKLVDLPRSTIASLESGQGNPSLSILAKLSSAFHLPIDQLLSPQKATCTLTKLEDTVTQERSNGNVKIRKLLPDKLSTMDIDRIEIQPGFTMRGIPHAPGTKEYFHCLEGEFTVKISGEDYILNAGDTLAFPGQATHSYFNSGKKAAMGMSVVIMMPLSS